MEKCIGLIKGYQGHCKPLDLKNITRKCYTFHFNFSAHSTGIDNINDLPVVRNINRKWLGISCLRGDRIACILDYAWLWLLEP